MSESPLQLQLGWQEIPERQAVTIDPTTAKN